MILIQQGWVTDSGFVEMERVQIILGELGLAEDEIFKKRQKDEIDFRWVLYSLFLLLELIAWNKIDSLVGQFVVNILGFEVKKVQFLVNTSEKSIFVKHLFVLRSKLVKMLVFKVQIFQYEVKLSNVGQNKSEHWFLRSTHESF